jgi:hypothetical protein
VTFGYSVTCEAREKGCSSMIPKTAIEAAPDELHIGHFVNVDDERIRDYDKALMEEENILNGFKWPGRIESLHNCLSSPATSCTPCRMFSLSTETLIVHADNSHGQNH